MAELPVVRDPPPDADRIRPFVLLAVAAASMLVGFLVVFLPGRGCLAEETAMAEGPGETGDPVPQQSKRPVLAVQPRPSRDVEASPATSAPDGSTTAPATASTPPASASSPDGGSAAGRVALKAVSGDVFYWRCWAEGQDDPLPTEHCDRLRTFEPRVEEQTATFASCGQQRGSGPGRLSLGLELDFAASRARFWAGRSSTIANAADVASCIGSRWQIDMESIRHVQNRYTVFVPVDLEPR